MRHPISAIPLLALGVFAACAEPITGPSAIVHLERALTPGEQRLVAADNAFAFALFR